MTSTLKKVKVSFKEHRLLLPLTQTTGPVSGLLKEATLRFRAQRLLAPHDSFIELRTLDGYIISPSDLIEQVIEQNDYLEVVNREAWLDEFKKTANPKYWFGIRQYDYYAKLYRTIKVSYSAAREALVISTVKGDKEESMEIFDRDTLTSYAKDGTLLVLHDTQRQDEQEYTASAHFVVQKSRVTAIRLEMHTLSDIQARISEWPITLGEGGFSYGEETVIQKNWPAAPSKEYKLPAAKSSGKGLIQEESERPKRDLVADPNVSTGDSVITYTQSCHVVAEKYADYKRTQQTLRVEFLVNNVGTVDTSNARTVVDYQKADGTWVAVEGVSRGERQNDWNWHMNESAQDPIMIPARSLFKLAFEARLPLPLQNTLHTRSRSVDLSLPVPLKLRFSFTDQDGKSSVISVDIPNRNLDLPTLDSLKKDYPEVQKAWFVDEHTNGERFGVYYTRKSKDDSHIRFLTDSTYYSVAPDAIHNHTMTAIMENKDTVELGKFESQNYNGRAELLIDLEHKYAYAVKIYVSTKDHSIEDYVLLPKENW